MTGNEQYRISSYNRTAKKFIVLIYSSGANGKGWADISIPATIQMASTITMMTQPSISEEKVYGKDKSTLPKFTTRRLIERMEVIKISPKIPYPTVSEEWNLKSPYQMKKFTKIRISAR